MVGEVVCNLDRQEIVREVAVLFDVVVSKLEGPLELPVVEQRGDYPSDIAQLDAAVDQCLRLRTNRLEPQCEIRGAIAFPVVTKSRALST